MDRAGETTAGTVAALTAKSAVCKNIPGQKPTEQTCWWKRLSQLKMEKSERMKDDESHVKAKYRRRDDSFMLHGMTQLFVFGFMVLLPKERNDSRTGHKSFQTMNTSATDIGWIYAQWTMFWPNLYKRDKRRTDTHFFASLAFKAWNITQIISF